MGCCRSAPRAAAEPKPQAKTPKDTEEPRLSVNHFLAHSQRCRKTGEEPAKPLLIAYANYLGIDTTTHRSLFWLGMEALAAPLPTGWTEHTVKSGEKNAGAIYFYHQPSERSSWVHPFEELHRETYKHIIDLDTDTLRRAIETATLPTETELEQWTPHTTKDPQSRTFFHNKEKGLSVWDNPERGLCYPLYLQRRALRVACNMAGKSAVEADVTLPPKVSRVVDMLEGCKHESNPVMTSVAPPAGIPSSSTEFQDDFGTLLEAFSTCDPGNTGSITDRILLARAAKKLLGVQELDMQELWPQMDRDGSGAVGFPEFVEWAWLNQVKLPIGLPIGDYVDFLSVPYPVGWRGSEAAITHADQWLVEDKEHVSELSQLLDVTYKDVWTRDREKSGSKMVPSGFEFVKALRVENACAWRKYYLKRHILEQKCSSEESFTMHRPLTHQASALRGRHRLRDSCNEWLLFHGTTADAATNIVRDDFDLKLSGTASGASGTLYGPGMYFTDSITKADEYSREDNNGLCCALLARVIGGRVNRCDDVAPDADALRNSITQGLHDSVLGDRLKCRGTFREFVCFDAAQAYPEYVVYYKRKLPTKAT